MKKRITLCFWLALLIGGQIPTYVLAQAVPEIGAQVWIEPGISPVQIEGYFATMEAHHMRVARLFMMWNYLEISKGHYDHALWDSAFSSAARHKVKIVATLMANHGPAYRGYTFKTQSGAIPATPSELAQGLAYVDTVIGHYGRHPALDSYILMNEPGQLPVADSTSMVEFRLDLKSKYETIEKLNANWISNFKTFDQIAFQPLMAGGGWTWPCAYMDWQLFWRAKMTRYLSLIAARVRLQDSIHGIHVNPHALLDIPHRYELPIYKRFLTSLGASIHPVWHFNALTRPDYPLGVAYVSDLVRTAAEPEDFWITELQGGHNIYTGKEATTPSAEEIRSWLWQGLGSGAKRIIFWCLNFRGQGTEAGEWGMVDYQGMPSDRLLAASQVGEAVEQVPAIFWQNAKSEKNSVLLLTSPTTRYIQERSAPTDAVPARSKLAHQFALLGVYKALKSKGIQTDIAYLDDSLLLDKMTGKIAILPHATALTEVEIRTLKRFVSMGNRLIVTGLSGMYDEYEKSRYMQPGGPWQDLVGGQVAEVRSFDTPNKTYMGMPAEVYYATLKATSKGANAFGSVQNLGLRHRIGAGQVVWIPACVDIGAYTHTPEPLAGVLIKLLAEVGYSQALSFTGSRSGMVYSYLQAPTGYLLVATNSSKNSSSFSIKSAKKVKWKQLITPATHAGKPAPSSFVVSPGQTAVWLGTAP